MGTEYELGKYPYDSLKEASPEVELFAYEMSGLFEVYATREGEEFAVTICEHLPAVEMLEIGIKFINVAYLNLCLDPRLKELIDKLRELKFEGPQ